MAAGPVSGVQFDEIAVLILASSGFQVNIGALSGEKDLDLR